MITRYRQGSSRPALRAAGVAASVMALGVGALIAAAPALAGTSTCSSYVGDCETTYNYTGNGGQAKITVDYQGSSHQTQRVNFYNPDGSSNCYFDVKISDPPQTRYCNWAKGKGTYKASAVGFTYMSGNTTISLTRS